MEVVVGLGLLLFLVGGAVLAFFLGAIAIGVVLGLLFAIVKAVWPR